MELEPSWARGVLPPPTLGTQGLTLPSKEGAHSGASTPCPPPRPGLLEALKDICVVERMGECVALLSE